MQTNKLDYERYESYSAEDFLQDDFFVHSLTHPTDESEKFWGDAVNKNLIDKDEFRNACHFIRSVQVKQEWLSYEEVFDLWENIEVRNKDFLKKRRRKLNFYYLTAAGISAIFISLFFYYDSFLDITDTKISGVQYMAVPDSPGKDIQLVLSDDKIVSLEGQEAEILYNERGIEINRQETGLGGIHPGSGKPGTYNQLVVPLGKRSILTLTDGSRLWINSGTRLVFPVFFEKNKREIYVDGEVFVDVVPMKNKPFIVKTKAHSIEVLGTSFNLTAYEKDTIQNIVLVTGAIKIRTDNEKETILSPNEMYTYVNGQREVRTVDVEKYISWRNGIYQYQSEELGVILTRLARYYGEEIVYTDDISHLKCSGKLDLKDDLHSVLKGIATTAPIRCRPEDGKYIISKKEV